MYCGSLHGIEMALQTELLIGLKMVLSFTVAKYSLG